MLMLGLTLWLGLFALGGTVFLLDPFPIPATIPFPIENIRPVGVLLLGATVAYLAATDWWRRPIRIRDVEFVLPQSGLSMLQVCVASVDIVLAAGCLYVLLPTGLGLGFFSFVGIYVLAVVTVIISHVPGGLGVLELTVLALASPGANEQVVAALLAYRAIYYLLPLVVAVTLLGGYELLLRRAATQRVLAGIGHAAAAVIPLFLALSTFAAGAVLLVSGALPAMHGRMGLLGKLLPLPMIEASHFLGSLSGAALLLLAHGLQRRLDSAWWLTTLLLVAGIAFSILKGFDYEEATLLAIV